MQKQIPVAFPTTEEDSPPLETFSELSVPSKARKNAKPKKVVGSVVVRKRGDK